MDCIDSHKIKAMSNCEDSLFNNDTSVGQRKNLIPDGNQTHGLPDTSWEAMGLIIYHEA